MGLLVCGARMLSGQAGLHEDAQGHCLASRVLGQCLSARSCMAAEAHSAGGMPMTGISGGPDCGSAIRQVCINNVGMYLLLTTARLSHGPR